MLTLITEISDTEHRRSKSLPNTQSFHPMTTLEVIQALSSCFITFSCLIFSPFETLHYLIPLTLSLSLCLFLYYYFTKLFFTILVHLFIYLSHHLSTTLSLYLSVNLSLHLSSLISHLLPLFSSHYRVTGS